MVIQQKTSAQSGIRQALRNGELEHVVIVAGKPAQAHSSLKAAICALALAMALAGCAGAPQLRNVAVHADVSVQVSGSESYVYNGINYGGGHVGRLGITLDQPVTREVSYRLGVEHTSLLDTSKDRGEERAFAGFTWRPFGGAR